MNPPAPRPQPRHPARVAADELQKLAELHARLEYLNLMASLGVSR